MNGMHAKSESASLAEAGGMGVAASQARFRCSVRSAVVLPASLAVLSASLAWNGARAEPPMVDAARIDYAEALSKSFLFYEAQRSGTPSPRIDWRRPAALKDGSDVGVELSGGWFDAGDHVKFGLPMAYSAAMLGWSLLEDEAAYTQTGQLGIARENLRFALDYFLAAYREGDTSTADDDVFYYQVGDGGADHAFWGPPERMTMPRPAFSCTRDAPCTEVAAGTAAALAIGARVFGEVDAEYAGTLIAKAQRLYRFAELRSNAGYVRANGFYTSYSGFWDELAWGATWLYIATSDASYLATARETLEQAQDSLRWSHCWDNVSNGTTLLLARITADERYHERMRTHLDHWLTALPRTEGGLAFLNEYGSLRYASTTAFIALLHARSIEPRDPSRAARYRDFARAQIDYILGDNPRRSSYVVGVGPNPPRNPHHRAAHASPVSSIDEPRDNTYTLTGALVGGPKSADDFAWRDDRRDYVANEVATDYNAGYTGALAALISLSNGAPARALTTGRIAAAIERPAAPSPKQPSADPAFERAQVGMASAEVRITSDWGAGYCAEVFVSTRSATPVRWNITLPIEGKIRQLWNARYSVDGSKLEASGVDWNQTVRAGEPAQFGFCAERR